MEREKKENKGKKRKKKGIFIRTEICFIAIVMHTAYLIWKEIPYDSFNCNIVL